MTFKVGLLEILAQKRAQAQNQLPPHLMLVACLRIWNSNRAYVGFQRYAGNSEAWRRLNLMLSVWCVHAPGWSLSAVREHIATMPALDRKAVTSSLEDFDTVRQMLYQTQRVLHYGEYYDSLIGEWESVVHITFEELEKLYYGYIGTEACYRITNSTAQAE